MNTFIRYLRDLHYRLFGYLTEWLGGLSQASRSYRLAEMLGGLRNRVGYLGRDWSRGKYLKTIRVMFPRISPSEAEALLKAYWINHQKRFMELFLTRDLQRDSLSRMIDFEGLEHLDRALAQGRGVILPVPHIGNERLHHIALAVRGYPVAVISSRYEDHGPYAQSVKIEASKRFHEVGYAGDTVWLMRMLKRNRVLQVASTAEADSQGVYVKFLGQEMLLPSGWVRLALMTGAAVLPSALLRQADNRHLLAIYPEFQIQGGASKEATRRENVQRYMDLVSRIYQERPDQIDWMSLTVRLEETRRSREILPPKRRPS